MERRKSTGKIPSTKALPTVKRLTKATRHRRDIGISSYVHFERTLVCAPRIVLSRRTQEDLNCVVCENVTSERPWAFVPKELFEDSWTYNYESELLPLRLDILTYPRDRLLLVYVPDELRTYDEFILCLNEKTEDEIAAGIVRFQNAIKRIVSRAAYRDVHLWESLGSEREIEEYTERNNRPLLFVEVEAAYPVMTQKVQFKYKLAADAHVYAELHQTGIFPTHIAKKLKDAAVQAAPSTQEDATQTICRFTTNTATQYSFQYADVKVVPRDVNRSFSSFTSPNLNLLCNQITINSYFNLYGNDYHRLKMRSTYINPPKKSKDRELIAFSHFEVAKNKIITSVCWHPILTGTVAIVYSREASNVCRRGKPKLKQIKSAVLTASTVLIWCTSDELYPKVRLVSSKQITSVSFCPFNENVIVGTCKNGQVVIWDLKNKLTEVDRTEIFTAEEKKYKLFMSLFMNWMKNVEDKSCLPVTAQSDLKFSHTSTAVSIQWLSPYCRITPCGKYQVVTEGESETMQFVSCGLDGSVLFWDLLAKPVSHTVFMSLADSTKRPKPLTIDASPFRCLNRVLKPVYQLKSFRGKKLQSMLITSFTTPPLNITYETPDTYMRLKLTDRIAYKFIAARPSGRENCNPEINCGTCDGYFFKSTWEGYDIIPGEIVNSERLIVTSIGRYHDGPITSISRHPDLHDIYLTVGGKVFAVWKDNFKDRPVFWRKSRQKYMHGVWDTVSLQSIMLSTSDGRKEVWVLTTCYDRFHFQEHLSGRMLLGIHLYPFKLDGDDFLGVAHCDGTFGMMVAPGGLKQICYRTDNIRALLNKAIERKKAFISWQKSWLENHSGAIRKRDAKINIYKQEKILKQKREEERQRAEELQRKGEEKRQLAMRRVKPVPEEFFKCAREQWRVKEEEHTRKVLLARQRLPSAEILERNQIPLKQAQMEEEQLQRKLKKRLRNSEKIFRDTVAMLFPDAIKKDPPPPFDPYAGGDTISEKHECFCEYANTAKGASLFIEKNPYYYQLHWSDILQVNTDKRRSLINFGIKSHRDRHFHDKVKHLQFTDT